MNIEQPTPAQLSNTPWLDPDKKPLIRFQNVTKQFGAFTAIDNLNLEIHEREFFALLGPSGCGKTTMMRLLAGFETPTEGKVLLDGEDISKMPANKRPVNMMFQSYALFPHMSVEKNIGFGLKQDGWSKSKIKDRVDEMLSLVQLESFAHRKPHQLSGGQKQRVALARSLAKKPKVLLLDEPLGALDKKLREQTQFELSNIQEELGLTFLIVTHDQEEAMTVSTRIAIMKAGEVLQVDQPSRIYEHPASSYVADFVGNVNLLGVTLTDTSGDLIKATWGSENLEIAIRRIEGEQWTSGEDVRVVLRPEKIHISKDAPEEAENVNVVQGTVEEISYTGSVSTYHVKLSGGSVIKVQQANRMLLDRREITWGDKVWLHWRAGACVLVEE